MSLRLAFRILVKKPVHVCEEKKTKKKNIGASWELNPGPLACFAVVRTPFIEASPGY